MPSAPSLIVVPSVQELRDVMARAVDSMFVAELPRDVHVRDLVDRGLRLEGIETPAARFCPALTSPVSPAGGSGAYEADYYKCICCHGIHRHRETCHHDRHGLTGCRFDAPWTGQPSTHCRHRRRRRRRPSYEIWTWTDGSRSRSRSAEDTERDTRCANNRQ